MEDQSEITVTTRQVSARSLKDITAMITAYLTVGEMRNRMSLNCYGCRVDHPSQVQHMDNGCLMEWESAVEQYYEDTLAFVKTDDVWDATLKIMGVLSLPVPNDVSLNCQTSEKK